MISLFGIPNCETVKKARVFLERRKVNFTFVDFKKTPPSENDIIRWEKAFGELPVNKAGQTYKKHKDVYEKLSPKEKIGFLISNSSMIKRPILERDGRVLAFGFKDTDYEAIF